MNTIINQIQMNAALLNLMRNGVVVIDKRGNLVFLNQMAEKLLDLKFDKVKGMLWSDVHPQTNLLDVLLTENEKHDYTAEINGRQCVVTKMPIYEDAKIVGAFAIFSDTCTLDLLNDALVHERDEVSILKMILEIAYDGIVVVDKDAKITMISNAYKNFLGLKDEQLIGKSIVDVIENTRMHIVVKTGVPEINELQLIKGNYMVATRIPYYVNDSIAGAVGKVIFRNVDEIEKISRKNKAIERELRKYRSEIKNIYRSKYRLEDIVSKSSKINQLKNDVKTIANSDITVLLSGESGTGKELFAHAVHMTSNRAEQPFVVMNCAAIPENLLEAELFGYEAGAFTDASKDGRMGKFEMANNGTLFLDEIGDMPLNMQAKILRVLQEREVERLGGKHPVDINVRLIAATNRNLPEMVKNGTFREDLYYRLNVFSLKIPSLRERKEDIEVITYYLLDRLNARHQKGITKVSSHALNLLNMYDWPGNVRELKNIIERAYNIAIATNTIEVDQLPHYLRLNLEFSSDSLKSLVEKAEVQVIRERLVMFKGNKTKTAKSLNISRVSLHKKIEKYNIM